MKILQTLRHYFQVRIYDALKQNGEEVGNFAQGMTEEDIRKMEELLLKESSENEFCYVDGDELVVKRKGDEVPIRIPISETDL